MEYRGASEVEPQASVHIDASGRRIEGESGDGVAQAASLGEDPEVVVILDDSIHPAQEPAKPEPSSNSVDDTKKGTKKTGSNRGTPRVYPQNPKEQTKRTREETTPPQELQKRKKDGVKSKTPTKVVIKNKTLQEAINDLMNIINCQYTTDVELKTVVKEIMDKAKQPLSSPSGSGSPQCRCGILEEEVEALKKENKDLYEANVLLKKMTYDKVDKLQAAINKTGLLNSSPHKKVINKKLSNPQKNYNAIYDIIGLQWPEECYKIVKMEKPVGEINNKIILLTRESIDEGNWGQQL
ncbi:hypothetical protein ABEB36_015565 [Hypothenemus hampei]|uniref:Uncharacterized protein n=1 Tax=Hypothenemus hampei TaxID=57062 RepID=A0ABD1E0E9_HYPHA